MSIVTDKSICIICGKPIDMKKNDWFGTIHFIDDKGDPLFKYSDGIFHKDCYEKWELKDKFEEKFKEWKKRNKRFECLELEDNTNSMVDTKKFDEFIEDEKKIRKKAKVNTLTKEEIEILKGK